MRLDIVESDYGGRLAAHVPALIKVAFPSACFVLPLLVSLLRCSVANSAPVCRTDIFFRKMDKVLCDIYCMLDIEPLKKCICRCIVNVHFQQNVTPVHIEPMCKRHTPCQFIDYGVCLPP